jgi:hypothetical protein
MAKDYQALYEACKQQAQIWKQEARCANDTIAQIYQLVTGKKGEPGNWNGAKPIKALVAERNALRAALEATQFGFNHSRCPVCAGWNMGPHGETDRVHTPKCPVGIALQ